MRLVSVFIIIFLVILFVLIIWGFSSRNVSDVVFESVSKTFSTKVTRNIFEVHESINFLSNLTSENNINIEAVSFENNKGLYIVDKESLFSDILEDNDIFFIVTEGITIELNKTPGSLAVFLGDIEPKAVFYTETGRTVLI